MLGKYGRHYVVPSWRLFDATGQSVGKLASNLSRYLQGKHKPNFEPSMINGDYCVVINTRYIQFRGENAWRDKKYFYHTRYHAGLKIIPAYMKMKGDPTDILRKSVRKMLPKTKQRQYMTRFLKIYPGPYHPFQQQLTPLRVPPNYNERLLLREREQRQSNEDDPQRAWRQRQRQTHRQRQRTYAYGAWNARWNSADNVANTANNYETAQNQGMSKTATVTTATAVANTADTDRDRDRALVGVEGEGEGGDAALVWDDIPFLTRLDKQSIPNYIRKDRRFIRQKFKPKLVLKDKKDNMKSMDNHNNNDGDDNGVGVGVGVGVGDGVVAEDVDMKEFYMTYMKRRDKTIDAQRWKSGAFNASPMPVSGDKKK